MPFGLKRRKRRESRALALRGVDAEIVEEEPGRDMCSDNAYIAKIRARSPDDAKYLHPGEVNEQRKRAPKYFRNPQARDIFMRYMEKTEAQDAYLYFPLGADQPNVMFHNDRYTVPEFEEVWGTIDEDTIRRLR